MDVTGLSIQDILSMDWEDLVRLNNKDIRSITNRLVSASNKRIRRLGKSELGIKAPAYQSYLKRGRMFSVKGKDRNEVLSEFKKASSFLNAKTSTMKGWKNVIKESRARIKQEYGQDIPEGRIADVFSTLHKAQEEGKVGGRGSKGSAEARDILFDLIIEQPNFTNHELEMNLDLEYTKQYEEDIENEEDEDDGFSI